MIRLLNWADTHRITLALTPDSAFGGSVPRLKKFYGHFGFVLNTGRNKDYEINELMYRLPRSLPRRASVKPPKNTFKVQFKSKTPLTLTAEGAFSNHKKSKGLMFRKLLPQNQCMVFFFQETRFRKFWMKNTYLPLDIIFVDEKRTVINIEHGSPLEESSFPQSEKPAKYVVETNAGVCQQYGITTGCKIKFLKANSKG